MAKGKRIFRLPESSHNTSRKIIRLTFRHLFCQTKIGHFSMEIILKQYIGCFEIPVDYITQGCASSWRYANPLAASSAILILVSQSKGQLAPTAPEKMQYMLRIMFLMSVSYMVQNKQK